MTGWLSGPQNQSHYREVARWEISEIWAGFGPVCNTEKKIWADYEQLLRVLFFMFSGAKKKN